ncbi:MAG: PfkB family carbohydrate kinase, partial [Cryobacterium sp.]
VGSGSLPERAAPAAPGFDPASFYPELVRMAVARGIPSIIDTSGPALLAAADAGATVLKPNREELIAATGIGDPILAARSLIERGASLVLLSLGVDGMVAVSSSDPSGYLSARLPEPLIGNPTGAGDAAVAAVASCLAGPTSGDTIGIEAILRRATAWSAAAVLMPLAGEISPLHAALEAQLIIEHHGANPSPATTNPPTEKRP